MRRASFEFKLTYFKDSGKYYTDALVTWDVRCICDDMPFSSSMPNMNDVVAKVVGLRDDGGQGSMPGLSDQSAGWDGFILVECEQGFPCLIKPR